MKNIQLMLFAKVVGCALPACQCIKCVNYQLGRFKKMWANFM